MEFSLNPLLGYNAIFAGMIFVSILYFAIASLTGMGGDDGDAPDGHDVDHDYSGDADVDGNVDGHDHDHDHDSDHYGGGVADVLTGLLNTEHRCPITYAVFIMLLIWGVSGYLLNALLMPYTPSLLVIISVLFSHVIAGFIAIMVTRRIAPIVARSIPSKMGICVTSKDFVGKSAIVSSILDSKESGMIEVDMGASVTKLKAKLINYDGPSLRRGERVLITAHVGGDLYECVKA